MHHRAGAVVHDGVILVLTRMRMTIVAGAALLLAVEVARTEVPAAGALHDIATQRRHVSHLRSSRMASGVSQRRVAFLDLRISRDFAQSRERPQMQTVLVGSNSAKAADIADID